MTHERIYLWFADNGEIRKWQPAPLTEGVEYVREDLLAAAQAKARGWRRVAERLESEKQAAQAELARVRGLLDVARCPNCDGSGAIPHGPTPDGDWELEQCQWCDERGALSQPAEQAPLMIRYQVCEHHTPVEPEPAQREGS